MEGKEGGGLSHYLITRARLVCTILVWFSGYGGFLVCFSGPLQPTVHLVFVCLEHATRARRRVIPRPLRRRHTTVRLGIAFATSLPCAASVKSEF